MTKVWNKNWLKEKYRDELLTTCEIAELANCTTVTVTRWLDKHDIERISRGERNAKRYGKRYYNTESWNSVREKVRERDDYTCQYCGVKESEMNRELDVHHLIPWRLFSQDGNLCLNEADKLNNLVSLCRSCHQKWEGVPLRPSLIE